MRSIAMIPALSLLAATLTGCGGGATEAECKAAHAKLMESLIGDGGDLSEKKKKSAEELEKKAVEGCMASRKKGFGDCVVSAPDAPGRMECNIRFTK